MKTTRPFRISTLVCVLVVLGGCKAPGDATEEDPAAEAASGSSGSGDNSPPSIWGDPDTRILVQTQYHFSPEAEDADGDVLAYEIVNKPDWAAFDAHSGSLQGVPEEDDIGAYQNIIISVTDSDSVVSLPSFTVQVTSGSGDGGDDGGDPATSSPPTIAGEPNTKTKVGSSYSFQPEASDPDGDELSFSIVNRPSWAEFATASGKLSGQPGYVDVGTSDPIGISVTDGESVSALNEFTITVEETGSASYTLSWTPPTQNEDGTPLTNLAGYRIYYGTSPGDYSETIEIGSAGLTSYMIDDLSPGTYYLVMTSVNSQDTESRNTPELEIRPGS